MSVATKVLHLKPPRLFPVLDRFVAVMLGLNEPDDATYEERVAIAAELTFAVRREGWHNLTPLRAIRDALAAESIHRPLVRVFDAILWFSHPAAGVPGAHCVMSVHCRD